MTDAPVAEARSVRRTYRRAGLEPLVAVHDVSLSVAAGEVVAITGPSGSGKSTLLFLLAGLDEPDEGDVLLLGTSWSTMEPARRDAVRRRDVGFIPQGQSLLPQATAIENVAVPLLLDDAPADEHALRVEAALALVGMTEHAAKLPDQLSGGQRQRIAVARAFINDPAVLIADEPTASLDSDNAQQIVTLLVQSARERHAAVVLVTHDPAVARHADRVLPLHSGRLDGAA